MSKTAQIEKIVLTILADKEWHTITEFRNEMKRITPELLDVSNTLSSTLYQMRKKKHLIEKNKKGVYRLAENENVMEEKKDISVKNEILDLWRKFYYENAPLLELSYEMDEEEFRRGKKMYDLNKKMENLIKSYK